MRMRRSSQKWSFGTGWLLVGMLASVGVSAETLPSLDVRFAPKSDGTCEVAEVPDFQKHISPLMGRLGCNGRACHGSFQGRGGFMLSLFGYDFEADHKAMFDEKNPRIDLKSPTESLILTKPVDADLHEGGERYKKFGWEYWVLRKWIEAGAPLTEKGQKENHKLKMLEVTPLEISFETPGKTVDLKAIAVWEDGTREEVTSLCRFFSNDNAIAKIDEHGRVTGGEKGDTHVVVAYDNAVVPVTVIRPMGSAGQLKTEIAKADNEVDRLVLTKLDKVGIKPSGIADDAEFFRRAALDITGTLPTSEQVREFLADRSPDKRERAVDEFLSSPGYAALWATFFCDITGNNDDQLRNFSYIRETPSQHWYQWIYDRINRNVPYDEMVEGIVTAVSREPGESYREYCEAMTKIVRDPTGKSFAERSDMMYYWARINQRTAEERAISFAYAFCGVRIQCAQCHKHPFDQWSKKDFDQFEKLFDGLQANQGTLRPDSKDEYEEIVKALGVDGKKKGNQLAREIQDAFKDGKTDKIVPFPELYVRLSNQSDKKVKDKKKTEQVSKGATARLLGGDFVDLGKVEDPRIPLMDWLRRKDNPYFAKSIVNRVWAHYFQVGIVNPPDDLNLANAPSNGPLLDYLATAFVENGYDLKWLHRTIVNSDTYQRTWRTNPTNELDRRNFSHSLLRRLRAETAYDALRIALSSDRVAASMCNLETDRAMTLAGASARNNGNGNKNGLSTYALTVFGRSIRESNCDCDRTSDPSLLQTVFIRNDSDVLNAMVDSKRSWLAQVAEENGWKFNLAQGGKDDELARREKEKEQMERETEELERKVRTYRAQLKNLTEKDGKPNAIRDAKSRLKLAEKRLADQLAKIKNMDAGRAKETSGSKSVASAGRLDKVQAQRLIEETYLRTVSRKPTTEELKKSEIAIAQAESPLHGLSDLLWVLINSKEFILNH